MTLIAAFLIFQLIMKTECKTKTRFPRYHKKDATHLKMKFILIFFLSKCRAVNEEYEAPLPSYRANISPSYKKQPLMPYRYSII